MRKLIVLPILMLALALMPNKSNAQEHNNKEAVHKEGRGHDHDDEHHGKETKGHDHDDKQHGNEGKAHKHDGDVHAEEGGMQYGLNDTYNVTKHGVKLVLKFDKKTNAFIGYMLNTTNKAIARARVEVHLSNGTELGPTKPLTLEPKAKKAVTLKTTTKSFKSWSTHVEVGNNEHGHNHEGGEGHSKREHGEH